MSEYDGEVKLAVGLEAADVKRAASQLQAEIEKIFDSSAGKKTSKQFNQVASTLSRLSAQAEQLKEKMSALEKLDIPTDEYKTLQKEEEAAYRKLSALEAKLKSLEGSRRKGVGALKEDLKAQIDRMKLEYDNIVKQLEKMELDGTAYKSGADTDRYKQLQNQLANVNNQMRLATDKAKNLVDPAKKSSKAFEAVRNAVAKVASGIKKVASQIAKLSVAAIKKLGNAFGTVAKKVGNVAKRMVGIGGHLNSQDLSLKKIIKKVAMYALGIQTVISAVNKLRGYAKSALTEMAKQFDDVDTSISGIVNSFNQFKNSIGTIVQPLVNLFGPAIERIIQGMTAMSNKIANFMAVFTGQEYIYKATKSNKKYADSLKKTSDAAKEANEKLGEYDNLLVIQQQNQSDKSDSSTEPMFEKVAVEPSGFAESLKDSIAKGDWASIGRQIAMKLNTGIESIDAKGIARSIAEKINNATSLIANFLTTFNFAGLGEKIGGALSTFLTTINWENIATSIGASIKGKVDFISGFFESVEWEEATTKIIDGFKKVNWRDVASSIIRALRTALSSAIKVINTVAKEIDGKKIGEDVGSIFNEIVTSIGELIEELDWQGVAEDIGGFLSGAIGNIDWANLWRTTNNLVSKLFDAMSTILSEIDWEGLGHNIYEGFTSIDYGQLFDSIFKFVGTAIGGLGQLIGTFIMDGIADMWEYFGQSIEDSGGDIVLGILNGIINALLNIGKWIYDHIFKPIWDGICEVFGIASPSKKMEEIGGFIVEGFLNAFDNLAELFGKIWEGLVTVVKAPINLIIGFINTMIDAVESVINFLIDGLNCLSFDTPDWLPGWLGGGKHFGFDIPNVSFGRIPALAQGAVIPPNREFLALLGDQNQGTNIEAPLDTIVEAFNMALNSHTDTRQAAPIVLQLNGRTVAQCVWDEEEKRYRQTGSYRPSYV